jgi:hypothetical protein
MSRSPPGGFINLNRTFHELSDYAQESDEVDLPQAFRRGSPMAWADLKSERRVVLLAEAGAGKTAEIRQAAVRWRAAGEHAFFLRLEHVSEDFDTAFEIGDLEGFEHWKSSSDAGWVLLDSVDEARLRGPKDFERAILRLAERVRGSEDRLHLLITSRMSAWRPRTDLEFCERILPPPASGRRLDSGVEEVKAPAEAPDVMVESVQVDERPRYRIVTIDDLDATRIRSFAQASGVETLNLFLEAVERRDAWSYTRRPQDLVELVEFWREHGKIGSRLDLVRSSVTRRLKERSQAHAEWQPLAAIRARSAARQIAAACILTHESTIQVPDGSASGSGLQLEALLPEWNAREVGGLLSLPLFDEAIYGAVRFHHREAREYLAAEWFADLLRREASRVRIEALFFRQQYDLDVIAPATRPILPWLALLDDRIRERLLRVAPQVLFEGGDPSQLPKQTREAILHECCRGLAKTTTPRTFTDYAAVQRFAAPDLVELMRELFRSYAESDEVTSFLCRMIWIGVLPELRTEARATALREDASPYTRIVAVRALGAIRGSDYLREVRSKVMVEGRPINRELLAELMTVTFLGAEDVEWIVTALRAADPPRPHSVDRVAEALKGRIEDASAPLLRALTCAFGELLAETPQVDALYCPISQTWAWLTAAAGEAIARLIVERDPMLLEEPTLALLRRVGLARHRHIAGLDESRTKLVDLVKDWETLNRLLFWHEVGASRLPRNRTDAQAVTHLSYVWPQSGFWRFGGGDFEYFVGQISAHPEPDDRAVALSVALTLFGDADCPEAWRKSLMAATQDDDALGESLRAFFDPPPETEELRRWRRQERAGKLRAERAELQEARRKEGWRKGLQGEVDRLRESSLDDPPAVSHSQSYLLDCMRETEKESSRWTNGSWEGLIPEFGADVAEAFRDGACSFWRRYDPPLRSEGAAANSTPTVHVFGLAGLAIEARNGENWASQLSPEDATKAARYAVGELNGFPTWLPQLFAAQPDSVLDVLMMEIKHQLKVEALDDPYHYVLDDASWAGNWCWDALGPRVVSLLGEISPRRPESLEKLLIIVHGSAVADEAIVALAKHGVANSTSTECRAVWFAALVGVEPELGISQLRDHLDSLNNPAAVTEFAMQVVTHLVGGRGDGGIRPRTNFIAPRHLAVLYALMHEHVRQKEDINRVGGGVYSPGLRDNAQDARDGLFRLLEGIPGKEAFLALSKLAEIHPVERMRPYMMLGAARRAEADANLAPWNATQVQDFIARLERTPRDHRELADLILLRFLDLKADMEGGDESLAPVILRIERETEMRNFLAGRLRSQAQDRYSLAQESELADGKRPDLRFEGKGFDAPVPAELKLADRWLGPKLLERLENQLCGDYLRDPRSRRGFFVLVHNGKKKEWTVREGDRVNFEGLVKALEARWRAIAENYPEIDDVRVVGINLPFRTGVHSVDEEVAAAPQGRATKKPVRNQAKAKRPSKGKPSKAGGSSKSPP